MKKLVILLLFSFLNSTIVGSSWEKMYKENFSKKLEDFITWSHVYYRHSCFNTEGPFEYCKYVRRKVLTIMDDLKNDDFLQHKIRRLKTSSIENKKEVQKEFDNFFNESVEQAHENVNTHIGNIDGAFRAHLNGLYPFEDDTEYACRWEETKLSYMSIYDPNRRKYYKDAFEFYKGPIN